MDWLQSMKLQRVRHDRETNTSRPRLYIPIDFTTFLISICYVAFFIVVVAALVVFVLSHCGFVLLFPGD